MKSCYGVLLMAAISLGGAKLGAQGFVNLTDILRSRLDAVYRIDPQLHAISDQGIILGSLGSVHDLDSRQVFILRKSRHGYTPVLLGEYPGCEPVDIGANGMIVMNATLDGTAQQQAWTIPSHESTEPAPVFRNDGKSRANAMLGNKVATTVIIPHSRLEKTDQPGAANAYRQRVHKVHNPEVVTQGYIVDLHDRHVEKAGFLVAHVYNLSAQVMDLNNKGHYCGQSQGFSSGENMLSVYPYFADQDSTYRLLDGYQGNALAINDHDQVVGTWIHPLTGKEYGFFWDRTIAKTSEFDWHDLLIAMPRAINNLGIVVGKRGEEAFVWQGGQFYALDSVIQDLPAKWKVLDILDINDQNRIIGMAEFNSESWWFTSVLTLSTE